MNFMKEPNWIHIEDEGASSLHCSVLKAIIYKDYIVLIYKYEAWNMHCVNVISFSVSSPCGCLLLGYLSWVDITKQEIILTQSWPTIGKHDFIPILISEKVFFSSGVRKRVERCDIDTASGSRSLLDRKLSSFFSATGEPLPCVSEILLSLPSD